MTPTRDDATATATGLNGTHPPAAGPAEVEVGTPEFRRLNSRRVELIYKDNRGGLTAAEAAELARLEQVVTAAVDRKHPRPQVLTDEQRAYLLRLLGLPAELPGS